MKQRRKLFSESPEEKSSRRTAVGALGGVATATGAGIGYLGTARKERKERGKYLKENNAHSSAIKEIGSGNEKYLSTERSKLQENLKKELDKISDSFKKKESKATGKNQKYTIRKQGEAARKKREAEGSKELEEKMKDLKKKVSRKDSAAARKLTKKIEENKGKIDKLSKEISKRSRRNAIIGGSIGVASAIGLNEYLKRKD